MDTVSFVFQDSKLLKMPDGLDTMIGTKGTYVSGGEAQRLSIARAMLKNAPILILELWL
jgi:ATP-binding cassette subfamily B protein IrtA